MDEKRTNVNIYVNVLIDEIKSIKYFARQKYPFNSAPPPPPPRFNLSSPNEYIWKCRLQNDDHLLFGLYDWQLITLIW